MEEAIFITGASRLKDCSSRYSRIYFGNEFCQRLIPAADELVEILNFISSKGLGFTFVTGFLTDPALDYLQDLLDIISCQAPNSEIVINDWGMLDMVKKRNLMPVIGRLLTKQRRDPRMLNLIRKLPPKAVECAKSAGIGSHLIQFLKDNDVKRMEIDNLPQDISLGNYQNPQGLRLSLYFPFNYVTTSRECMFNDGCFYSGRKLLPNCERKCKRNTVILKHHTIPLSLYMKGSTIFIKNRKMPERLLQKGIDRIIYQQDIPM